MDTFVEKIKCETYRESPQPQTQLLESLERITTRLENQTFFEPVIQVLKLECQYLLHLFQKQTYLQTQPVALPLVEVENDSTATILTQNSVRGWNEPEMMDSSFQPLQNHHLTIQSLCEEILLLLQNGSFLTPVLYAVEKEHLLEPIVKQIQSITDFLHQPAFWQPLADMLRTESVSQPSTNIDLTSLMPVLDKIQNQTALIIEKHEKNVEFLLEYLSNNTGQQPDSNWVEEISQEILTDILQTERISQPCTNIDLTPLMQVLNKIQNQTTIIIEKHEKNVEFLLEYIDSDWAKKISQEIIDLINEQLMDKKEDDRILPVVIEAIQNETAKISTQVQALLPLLDPPTFLAPVIQSVQQGTQLLQQEMHNQTFLMPLLQVIRNESSQLLNQFQNKIFLETLIEKTKHETNQLVDFMHSPEFFNPVIESIQNANQNLLKHMQEVTFFAPVLETIHRESAHMMGYMVQIFPGATKNETIPFTWDACNLEPVRQWIQEEREHTTHIQTHILRDFLNEFRSAQENRSMMQTGLPFNPSETGQLTPIGVQRIQESMQEIFQNLGEVEILTPLRQSIRSEIDRIMVKMHNPALIEPFVQALQSETEVILTRLQAMLVAPPPTVKMGKDSPEPTPVQLSKQENAKPDHIVTSDPEPIKKTRQRMLFDSSFPLKSNLFRSLSIDTLFLVQDATRLSGEIQLEYSEKDQAWIQSLRDVLTAIAYELEMQFNQEACEINQTLYALNTRIAQGTPLLDPQMQKQFILLGEQIYTLALAKGSHFEPLKKLDISFLKLAQMLKMQHP
ncbi:MAG: hypothetical protein H7832_03845 [Magnetococcus sp. DMHC-6]